MIQVCECPRDAMQGIPNFIPTEVKIQYLNLLLQVGFYRLDFGSFVSPKAIPQMRDTAALVDRLNLQDSNTQLLAIVANERGAREAAAYDSISVLGFPFSLSETFQQRNTHASREEALKRTEIIADICFKANKTPLVYLSMGFGNPYGDPWSPEIAIHYTHRLQDMGIQEIRIADTTGVSDIHKIKHLFPQLQNHFPKLTFGLHLHSDPATSLAKIETALAVGCKHFDSALRGFGGCPMAEDVLVGNIATETIMHLMQENNQVLPFNMDAWNQAVLFSTQVFG